MSVDVSQQPPTSKSSLSLEFTHTHWITSNNRILQTAKASRREHVQSILVNNLLAQVPWVRDSPSEIRIGNLLRLLGRHLLETTSSCIYTDNGTMWSGKKRSLAANAASLLPLACCFCVLISSDVVLAWTCPAYDMSLNRHSHRMCNGKAQRVEFTRMQQRRREQSTTLLAVPKNGVGKSASSSTRTDMKRAAVAVVESDSSTPEPPSSDSTKEPLHQKSASSAVASMELPSIIEDQQELISKITNGLFLAACFGFAIGSILNIDQGMTRGWTQSVCY